MSLTTTQRIKAIAGVPFFFSIKGEELSPVERQFLKKTTPSGIIYFRRNISSLSQLTTLTTEIKKLNIPLHGIDEEGGRVKRLPHGDWSLPSAAEQAKMSKPELLNAVKRLGETLFSCGINLNFAPVVDISEDENDTIIGDRSFGKTTKEVVSAASSVIHSLQSTHIHPVIKHFPGHGTTTIDSHKSLPTITKSFDALSLTDIYPFTVLKHRVDFIMTAHLLLPEIDSLPATLSPKWQTILREKIGFNGVIITDDLEMGALSHLSISERVNLFYQAGGDITLICSGKEDIMHEAWEASIRFLENNNGYINKNEQLEKKINTIIKERTQ